MKKIIIFIFLLPLNLFGQGYPDVMVKEFYDANLDAVLVPTTIEGWDFNDDDGSYLGDRVSKYLSSFVEMHETTKDKAYLVKFVKNSFIIQNLRKDNDSPPGNPIWSDLSGHNNAYLDGYILKAMAEFVYMVRNNSEIYNTTLPSATSLGINSQFYPSTGLLSPYGLGYTYGGYAKWLGDQVGYSLDWFASNGYWDDNKGVVAPSENGEALALNMQPGFGLAYYYMGACDPNSTYTARGIKIAELYKSEIYIDDECDCSVYGPTDVFVTLTGNNSYLWYDAGWNIPQDECAISYCPPAVNVQTDDYERYVQYPEDISHAVPDLWLPLAFMKFSPGSGYFDNDDMIRWRNTFAKNVYDSGDFHNNVDGGEIASACDPSCSINYLKHAAFAWMPFYQWDGDDATATSPYVYDIVMDLFVTDIEGNNNQLPSGFNGPYFADFADVVAAQWDIDCTNLTLYNRDVIYSQDFFSNNTLIVAPAQVDDFHASSGNSFAEPIITSNKFMIESGTTVNMTASEFIELHAGFEVGSGGVFTAAVVYSSSCTDGVRLANTSGNDAIPLSHAKENAKTEFAFTEMLDENKFKYENNKPAINEPDIKTSLNVTPNPFSVTTSIRYSFNAEGNAVLKIMDQYGRVVFDHTQSEKGNYNISFDAQTLALGVYYCILQVNGQVVETEKIVLIR